MEFLDQTILGNPQRSWLIAIAMAVLAVVVLRTLQSLARRRLAKLAALTTTQWDDHLVALLAKTRLFFWIFLGVLVGSSVLDLQPRAQGIDLRREVGRRRPSLGGRKSRRRG